MKKVVMLLSNGFNPDVRVHKEAKTLVENGYRVDIIVWDRLGELPKKETVDGIGVERVHLKSLYNNPLANAVRFPIFWVVAFFELLSRDFDVVHCHDFDTLLPGFLAGKLKRKKVVYDAHESYPAQMASKLPGVLVKVMATMERCLSRKVDSVITVNSILGGLFEKAGAKTTIVMNCQKLESYDVPNEHVKSLRKQIDPKDEFLIVYIGGFISGRGLEELIEALALLKGPNMPRLALFGRGALEDRLRQRVKERGIEKDVYFGGFIRPNEVAAYTKAGDLVVALYGGDDANNRFASPNKLFEAMAAGKPVMVTDVGILGEVVRKERNGIIVSEDPKKMAEGLKAVIDKTGNYRELANNSKNASARYNWGNEGQKLLSSYASVAAK